MNEFSDKLNDGIIDDDIDNTTIEDYDTMTYNPVEYSEMKPAPVQEDLPTGFKIFSLVLVMIIALSGATAAGYVYGKNKNSSAGHNGGYNQNLAARPDSDKQYTAAEVYSIINESIVGIRVYNQEGNAADASGVVYSEDGYIVTNDHIYSEISAPKFRVYLSDGSEYDATYVAGDTVSDLAVLKIVSENKTFKIPQFGDSKQIVSGENVIVIGRSNGASNSSSVTSGIISSTKRRMNTTSNYSASLIQTDSAINPGSSGGALVNMYGQIVGICSSKLAGIQYDSVGFAIPTTTLKRVADELIKNKKVTNRAKLGITYSEIDSVTANLNNSSVKGLLIEEISVDSDVNGKAKVGDIIVAVNGIEISHDGVLLDVLEESFAGDKIKLSIISDDGVTVTFDVKLKANIGETSYKG